MDAALRNPEPIHIAPNGSGGGILLDAKYETMKATLPLLSTPANAYRVRAGLSDYTAGRLQSGAACD